MSKKLKIVFFIVLVGALAFFVFQKFGGTKNTSSSGLVSEGTSVAVGVNPNEAPTLISQEELSGFSSLLAILESVQIDTTLFTKQSFISLKDNSVDLGDIKVGRKNPFIKIGQDDGGVNLSQLNSQALTIETVQPDSKSITKNSVEFSAFVEFEGTLPVDVVFQYGEEGKEMKLTNPIKLSASGFAKTTVTNLEQGKTYTVSSIGTRGANRQIGSQMTFSTKP